MTNIISRSGIKYAVTPSREARDAGYEHETRDCFVQALMRVTGVPYRDAHAFTKEQFKRRDGKGTCGVRQTMARLASTRVTIFGYRVFVKEIPTRTVLRRTRLFGLRHVLAFPTVSDSLYLLRNGRYLSCSNYHAWATIDGVIYDNGPTSNRTRLTECYQFVPSSECEAKGI